MTEDQEKELMEFAEARIKKNSAKITLRLGGNIDNFSSRHSQVLFLDKPNLPPVEESAIPWTVIIDGPYEVTSISQFNYADGTAYENTSVVSATPLLIRYREGDRDIFSPVAPPQLDYALYDFPDVYSGFFRQSTTILFSVRNYQFPVQLGLIKSEQAIINGAAAGPINTTQVSLDFTSSAIVEYPVDPLENTRVTITPVAITRL